MLQCNKGGPSNSAGFFTTKKERKLANHGNLVYCYLYSQNFIKFIRVIAKVLNYRTSNFIYIEVRYNGISKFCKACITKFLIQNISRILKTKVQEQSKLKYFLLHVQTSIIIFQELKEKFSKKKE